MGTVGVFYDVLCVYVSGADELLSVWAVGSADDQIHIWTVAWTKYVFMAGGCFCERQEQRFLSYYIYSPRFQHIGRSLLSRLPCKIIYIFTYLGLVNPAHRISSNPILTATVVHRCCKADYGKTAIHDGFILYNIHTDEFYSLKNVLYRLPS